MSEMGVPIRPETSSLNQTPVSKPDEHRINKVVTGKVVTRKPSVGKRVASAFIAEDMHNVKTYFIQDILIPGIKDGIISLVEMCLFGSSTRRRSGGNRTGGEYTSYSQYYYSNGPRYKGGYRDQHNDGPRDFHDIILASRSDAEEVISMLNDAMAQYGQVSVADLNDACGVTGEYTDNKWGWKPGSQFYIRRVNGGYSIDTPKVTMLG